MIQIVCLSHQPWGKFPSRTQHLMSRLKEVEILWFQPAFGPADRRQPSGRKVRPHITVYTLPPLRATQSRVPFLVQASWDRAGRFINEVIRRHRFHDVVLWCTGPRQARLLDRIEYDRLVYDCSADWSELPIEWESALTVQADVVFAASPDLADYLSPCSPNVTLLPNGVNYAMFDQAFPAPNTASFCWVGALYPDLDLDPLLYAARQRPDWSFTLIGPVKGGGPHGLDKLQRLPNVHLLGRRAPLDIPELLGKHSVCLNLLRDSDAGNGILPIHLYEYLATGKPIVSMLWPEQVEKLADVVYGAHDEREFLRMCQQALTEAPGWVTDRRKAYAKQAAWSERVAVVQRILDALSS